MRKNLAPFLISSIVVSLGVAFIFRAGSDYLEVVLALSLIAFLLCVVLGIKLKRPKPILYRLLIGGGITFFIHSTPLVYLLMTGLPPQD
tara:strand:- start:284 stop:550 length:267 start_codon:yes stop_codon:yes gene_type:complete